MLLLVAWRNLWRHARRSLLALLTVALGAGALFLFDGFNFGIMNQYKNNTVRAKYGHGQLNTKGYRDAIFDKPWEHWIEDEAALLASLAAMPEVQSVFPRIEVSGILQAGERNIAVKGLAVDGQAESRFFDSINIVEGKMLEAEKDGVILGLGLARSLGAKPGDKVTLLAQTTYGSLNGVDLRVVGLFHTGLKEVDDSHFRFQRSEAGPLLDTAAVESVAIALREDDQWPAFAQRVAASHPELEATSFAVLDKVYYQHAVDWLGQQFLVIQQIILLIVILGIGNSMAFSIMERTPEIGNLRANGESPRDVLALLVTEGALLGAGGSLLGLALVALLNATLLRQGILMPPAPGLTRQFYVQIELQPGMALFAFALGTLSACLATVLVAWRRVRMPIAAALRYR